MRYRSTVSLLAFLVAVTAGVKAASGAAGWPTRAMRVRNQLLSEDEETRRAAAGKLMFLPRASCARLALLAAQDQDVRVRLAGAQAAIVCGADQVAEPAVGWLTQGNLPLRLAACRVLRVFPRADAVGPLARLLGDDREAVRLAAVAALESIQDAGAEQVAALVARLDDPSERVRLAVVRALGRVGDARAVVPLLSRVQDNDASVRKAAVNVLGMLGDHRAASALLMALGDSSSDVRKAAARSIGKLRLRHVEAALATLLESEDSEERSAAAWALGRCKSREAFKLLMRALAQESPSGGEHPVREALVAWGEEGDEQLLAVVRGSGVRNAVAGAALALADRGHRHGLVRDASRAMADGRLDEQVWLEVVGRVGECDVLPQVLSRLQSRKTEVRLAAVRVTKRILAACGGSGLAVDPILERYRFEGVSDVERVRLVELLGATRSSSARRVLEELADSDGAARVEAIRALGKLRGMGVGDALKRALTDADPVIRSEAALAVARVGMEKDVSWLLEQRRRVDVRSWMIAASGVVSRVRSDKMLGELASVARSDDSRIAMAIWEGLARSGHKGATQLLVGELQEACCWKRAQLAMLLGTVHADEAEAELALLRLVEDADVRVRAHAAWSLGRFDSQRVRDALVGLLKDSRPEVVANAVASLGRMAKRTNRGLPKERLCEMLEGKQARLVRIDVFEALRWARESCAREADLWQRAMRDESPQLRMAAVEWMGALPRTPMRQRLLRGCVEGDSDALVVRACEVLLEGKRDRAVRQVPGEGEVRWRSVWVVPVGAQQPQPRGAFALRHGEGFVQVGWADDRGMVPVGRERGVVRLVSQ